MTHELDQEILLNKINNMSLEELFLFDPIKAVENIIGSSINIEEEETHPLLVSVLYTQNNCFKSELNLNK